MGGSCFALRKKAPLGAAPQSAALGTRQAYFLLSLDIGIGVCSCCPPPPLCSLFREAERTWSAFHKTLLIPPLPRSCVLHPSLTPSLSAGREERKGVGQHHILASLHGCTRTEEMSGRIRP